MDAIVYICITLFITIYTLFFEKEETPKFEDKPEDITRTTALNESYYEDPKAFSEMINAMGFGIKE